MNNNFSLNNKKSKKTIFYKILFSLFLGFIFGNYMLYSGNLDGIATKIVRLFSYESIKANVVKYDINYRVNK